MNLIEFKNKHSVILDKIEFLKDKTKNLSFWNFAYDYSLGGLLLIAMGFVIRVLMHFFGKESWYLSPSYFALWFFGTIVTASLSIMIMEKIKKCELDNKVDWNKLLTDDFLKDLWSCSLIKDDKHFNEEFQNLLHDLNVNRSNSLIFQDLNKIHEILNSQEEKNKVKDRFNDITGSQAEEKLIEKFSL